MATNEIRPAAHRQILDVVDPKNILIVVANPSVNPTLGWPLGFWAAELTHPYFEFAEAGHRVTIASPMGGKVEADALSDPRDASKWSTGDLVSMGFLETPECTALLADTPKVADLDWGAFDALVVCGGQSPMFTFRGNDDLQRAIRTFYEAKKITAVFCTDGSYLVAGKTVTGFANIEEDFSDAFVGRQVMPWRLEDALKERGANYIMGGLFKAFCARDGQLITGQQQYSARKVARMVIEALGA